MTESEWLASENPANMLRWLTGEGVKRVPPQDTKDGRLISDRKLRLFACACWRKYYDHWTAHPPGPDNLHTLPTAIAAAEKYADNPAGLPIMSVWPLDGPSGGVCAMETVRRIGGSEAVRELMADILREIVDNPYHPARPMWTQGLTANGVVEYPNAWLTPTVIALAESAYEERRRECGRCYRSGMLYTLNSHTGEESGSPCSACKGAGTIDDGTLDPDRLAVLSDALEEAGCPAEVECPDCDGGRKYAPFGLCLKCPQNCLVPNPLLAHLRSPGPHVRGMWSLDLILGKE